MKKLWRIILVLLLLIVGITVSVLIYAIVSSFCSRDLSILGLMIDVFAALTLAAPMLKSLREIGKEGTSLDGVNIYLVRSMIKDRAITLVGLVVLAIGFIFQFFAVIKS